MNALYALPDSVRIAGRRWRLHTDWCTALRVFAAFEDDTLTEREKQTVMLRLLYGETLPPDTEQAARLALKFLNCGQETGVQAEMQGTQTGAQARGETRQRGDSAESAPPEPRLYSFTADAPLIYAALCRTYGAAVLQGELHWWRFAALLADVDGDTLFARVTALRWGRAHGTLTKEQKQMAAALGPLMELPQRAVPMSAQAQEFFRAYRAGKGGDDHGNQQHPQPDADQHTGGEER